MFKSIMVFWVVTPCGISGCSQPFGGTQNTMIVIFTAVRTNISERYFNTLDAEQRLLDSFNYCDATVHQANVV